MFRQAVKSPEPASETQDLDLNLTDLETAAAQTVGIGKQQ